MAGSKISLRRGSSPTSPEWDRAPRRRACSLRISDTSADEPAAAAEPPTAATTGTYGRNLRQIPVVKCGANRSRRSSDFSPEDGFRGGGGWGKTGQEP